MEEEHHIHDLTGKTFGRWTVLKLYSYADPEGCKQTRWTCRCRCGTIKESVMYGSLTQGKSQSCGCLRREKLSRFTKARFAKSLPRLHKREYGIWMGIKTRCFNANHASYERYGAMGVTMCERWRNSFEAFFEDMGPCPEMLTIDRIDNNGNYEPGNCRWATRRQQAVNKSNIPLYPYQGEMLCISDIARRANVDYTRLLTRYFNPEEVTAEQAVENMRRREPERTFKERVQKHYKGRNRKAIAAEVNSQRPM